MLWSILNLKYLKDTSFISCTCYSGVLQKWEVYLYMEWFSRSLQNNFSWWTSTKDKRQRKSTSIFSDREMWNYIRVLRPLNSPWDCADNSYRRVFKLEFLPFNWIMLKMLQVGTLDKTATSSRLLFEQNQRKRIKKIYIIAIQFKISFSF